jgi:hypothetical protein
VLGRGCANFGESPEYEVRARQRMGTGWARKGMVGLAWINPGGVECYLFIGRSTSGRSLLELIGQPGEHLSVAAKRVAFCEDTALGSAPTRERPAPKLVKAGYQVGALL